jgi:hypothetical protein
MEARAAFTPLLRLATDRQPHGSPLVAVDPRGRAIPLPPAVPCTSERASRARCCLEGRRSDWQGRYEACRGRSRL